MSEENDSTLKIITKHQFYFETPLYEKIKLDILEEIFKGDVDAYSAKNQFGTTYEIECSRMGSYTTDPFYSFYQVSLTCKRRGTNDILYFFLQIEDDSVTKVGQLPSLADLHNSRVDQKYGKLLDKQNLHEFKKAIGLAAHGVGAGSLIYLRRVFERLIFAVFLKKKDDLKIEINDFKSKKMEQKVDILKAFLPKELSDMTSVYAILSKGLHELTEDECKQYFPALKLSIELILDEQIEIRKEELKRKKIKLALQNIHQNLSTKNES